MRKLVLPFIVPLIAACSSMPDVSAVADKVPDVFDIAPLLDPYRIDVRQGNLVTQEMVAQLKLGQTKDQVRFILGTPLLADIFHGDRWDYVYRLQTGAGEVQQRRLIVFFADGKLARLGGDVVADNAGAAAAAPKQAARIIEIKAPVKPADVAAEVPAASQ